MEDVKGKMKGILKKVNIPFSSPSSSSPFKGQAHVLGTSPTPPNPSSSRLLNPPPSSPATNIAASGDRSEPDITSRVGDFMSGEGSAEIVAKLLKNVVREPGNERFRRIRLGNLRIKEAVGDVRGGLELLECVGFRVKEEEGERWAVMEEPTRGRIDVIREAVSLMEGWKRKDEGLAVDGGREGLVSDRRVEPQKIDRKVRVFFSVPESVAAKIDLSDSFYKLSTEELKRESDARRKKIADSQLLIPRSYKEKQAMASRRKYKLTVIRIQFPDRVVLQGVFLPWEQTTVLYEFVSSSLKEANLEFELLSPAVPRVQPIPRFPGTDGRTPTLEEENLVPSALVKFKPVETDSIAFTGLADEILELIEPLTDAATLL